MQENLNNSADAKNLLMKIHNQNVKFIKYLQEKYPNEKGVLLLKKRYVFDNIEEVNPFNKSGNTSFVIDKGKKIGFCIRQKNKTADLVDENTIKYVILHELAHLMSKGYGHGTEFQNNFSLLLKEAHLYGIYVPTDYSVHNKSYCGIVISERPPLF